MDIEFRERGGAFASRLLSPEEESVWENHNNRHSHHGSVSESASSGLNSFLWTSSGSTTPLGSELGSTEMESDDDDFIAELTRQMADTMLREDDDDESAPDSASDLTKPEDCSDYNSGKASPTGAAVVSNMRNPDVGIYSAQALNHDHDHSAPFHYYQLQKKPYVKREGSGSWGSGGGRPCRQQEAEGEGEQKQQQSKKQRQMMNKRRGGGGHGRRARPPAAGSDMRVVFLGGSGSKKGSGGTGVFFPRGPNNATEPLKKSGCSTVLVPTRVLQVLNLHFNGVDALSPSYGCNGAPPVSPPFLTRQDGAVTSAGNGLDSQQMQYTESQGESVVVDVNLPQEWTYE